MTRTSSSAAASPGGPPEPPTLAFASRAEWETWLEEHHDEDGGVLIKLAKKGTGLASVTYAEAVEVALCFGWIDGQTRRFDESYWLQKFTPRRARSKWSKINRERATRLAEEGLIRPSGLREIERAKADGRWEAAYASPKEATVPDDLQAALDANEAARAFFATLSGQNRYSILHRVQDAKRAETRARRIEQFVTMLSEGRTLH